MKKITKITSKLIIACMAFLITDCANVDASGADWTRTAGRRADGDQTKALDKKYNSAQKRALTNESLRIDLKTIKDREGNPKYKDARKLALRIQKTNPDSLYSFILAPRNISMFVEGKPNYNEYLDWLIKKQKQVLDISEDDESDDDSASSSSSDSSDDSDSDSDETTSSSDSDLDLYNVSYPTDSLYPRNEERPRKMPELPEPLILKESQRKLGPQSIPPTRYRFGPPPPANSTSNSSDRASEAQGRFSAAGVSAAGRVREGFPESSGGAEASVPPLVQDLLQQKIGDGDL